MIFPINLQYFFVLLICISCAFRKVLSSDCLQTFNSKENSEGYFHSPNFPQEYTLGIQCKYIFNGDAREKVQILFEEFQLFYPSEQPEKPGECSTFDSVTVKTQVDGSDKDIGENCGHILPTSVMSTNNKLVVILKSNSPQSGGMDAKGVNYRYKGFRAKYRFLTNFGITSGRQDTIGSCIFTYTSNESKSGKFISPNYPGQYPRNTECQYVFKGLSDEYVHIFFLVFNVEGYPPCTPDTKSDLVEFSNFNFGIRDRKMSKKCGNHLSANQRQIESDGSFFRVIFTSNAVFDAKGFEARYEFRKKKDNHGRFQGNGNNDDSSSTNSNGYDSGEKDKYTNRASGVILNASFNNNYLIICIIFYQLSSSLLLLLL